MKSFLIAPAIVAFGFAAGPASAAVITLDFEGVDDQQAVGDFYAGGGGTDFGIEFSPNALALIDQDAGGGGNFANEPTPDTVLFFLTGDAATLNFASGFDTGFSFFYSAINIPGSIDVYSGVDATGDVLASLDLGVTPQGAGDPTGQFSEFVPIGVSFDGTARSIDFGGTENQIGFDNITFGSAVPGEEGGEVPSDPAPVVPLPASMPLLLAGLLSVAIVKRRRR